MDRQPDRASLLGKRTRDRLPDPPRGIRGELEAELVVELLDRADQTEVSLLDQIEQRHPRLGVRTRDRHHEAKVRFDQLLLRLLVTGVLAASELALLRGGEQAPVADLANVELERILGERFYGPFVDGLGDRVEQRLCE